MDILVLAAVLLFVLICVYVGWPRTEEKEMYNAPEEAITAWNNKEIRESELIQILGNWPYNRGRETDTWGTVMTANQNGLIPDHVYDAALEIAGNRGTSR